MSQQFVVEIIRQALMTALWVGLPLLAVMFVVGILISLLQIATSIQDPSFGTVPRLAGFLVTFLVILPWVVLKMVDYTQQILGNLGRYAH